MMWFGASACMVEGLNRMFKGKNGKKVKPLIWLTTIWSIWNMRNSIVLESEDGDVQKGKERKNELYVLDIQDVYDAIDPA
ncbi:hypothetical protein P8452_50557 [Trifolium repens]|nr:hypothetical protein P8452_50557 [Trifolium repens]